jgi:hypothetical protein
VLEFVCLPAMVEVLNFVLHHFIQNDELPTVGQQPEIYHEHGSRR